MSVRISICLPTRNSARFLTDRLESIENQTSGDWEVIAVDSHSDDGTFELLQEFAAKDKRVRVVQAPADGIYPNFNRCIRQAAGQFVYIATSDDTMAPDCLDKMVKALDENPDCDLAHCPMKVIEGNGGEGLDWWSGNSLFAKSSGAFLNRRHKRVAPFDGLLCMLGDNIYSSVTQLLIRRSLFDKIGFYQSDWGSVGDFHWNLRAGLAASTVHVPDTWGGWRMHGDQATAGVRFGSLEHRRNIDAMIDDVARNHGRLVGGDVRSFESLWKRVRDLRIHLREHGDQQTPSARRMFLIRAALCGRREAWRHLASMLSPGRRWPQAAPESVRTWFENDVLIPLPDNCP